MGPTLEYQHKNRTGEAEVGAEPAHTCQERGPVAARLETREGGGLGLSM